MTTASQIIKKAFQKSGIITKTETPSADELNDGLDTLNAMLSAWSNESLTIYARTFENFTLTSGVSSYSIGPSQTLNTTRPIFIVDAYVRLNNIDYPLATVTDEVYDAIAMKDVSGIPRQLNYSNGYPTATIRIYPVPQATYTLYLRSEKELSQFALNDTVSLPPGWEQALIWNLAVLIAPEYGQPITPELVALAGQSKANIIRSVLKNRTMDALPPDGGKQNIFTGWYK